MGARELEDVEGCDCIVRAQYQHEDEIHEIHGKSAMGF